MIVVLIIYLNNKCNLVPQTIFHGSNNIDFVFRIIHCQAKKVSKWRPVSSIFEIFFMVLVQFLHLFYLSTWRGSNRFGHFGNAVFGQSFNCFFAALTYLIPKSMILTQSKGKLCIYKGVKFLSKKSLFTESCEPKHCMCDTLPFTCNFLFV